MKSATFRIEADGADITALIMDRFLDLTVTDQAGKDSDTFALRLDNRDDKLQFPATGYGLRIWMGIDGSLCDKGLYQVDEITEVFPSGVLEVSGKAADMNGSLKAQKTCTWEAPLKLGVLLSTIARDHGYQPQCHPSLADIELGHINQKAESDLNLLNRMCEQHGALMKAGGGYLMAAPREAGENAAGVSLGEVPIDNPSESSGRVTIQERGACGSVEASYFDEKAQQTVNVVVKGGDGPKVTLKGKCKDRDEAEAKARAHLSNSARGRATANLETTLRPEIVSPGKVRITNHRQSLNGSWFVNTAEHTIGKGYSRSSLTLASHGPEASKTKKGRV